MGLFDKILKEAAKAIDNAIVNNGGSTANGNSFSEAVDKAMGVKHEATHVSVSAPSSAPASTSNAPCTPPEVLASGSEPTAPYKTVRNEYYEPVSSFELPEDFTEFRSHAEPMMCHLYKYDEKDDADIDLNKPYISLDCADFIYKAVESYLSSGTVSGLSQFQPIDRGHILFKAKNVNYYGKIVAFYGLYLGDRSEKSYWGLCMTYCRDAVGTPLEKKLMEILDHAAETYNEE